MSSEDSTWLDLETKVELAMIDLLEQHCRNTEGFGDRIFAWDHAHDVDQIETPFVVVKAVKQSAESNAEGDLWDVDVDVMLHGGQPIHARLIEQALGKAYDLHTKLADSTLGVEQCFFQLPGNKEFEGSVSRRSFPVTVRCSHKDAGLS